MHFSKLRDLHIVDFTVCKFNKQKSQVDYFNIRVSSEWSFRLITLEIETVIWLGKPSSVKLISSASPSFLPSACYVFSYLNGDTTKLGSWGLSWASLSLFTQIQTQGLSFLPMYPSGSAPSLSTAVALVRPHHLLPESPDQLLNWVSLPPAWLLLSILLSTARPSHAAHLAYSLLSVPGSLGAAIVLFATVALLPSTVPGVSVHSVKRWLNKCIN